jgi:parallel beta-helix repeat protein
MSDGDTLNFEAGEYRDICIYINKNITVNGNGATLIGYDTPSKDNTPEIIWKATNESGYAIGNLATLYIVKTTGVTINGLTIIGGANSASTYSNALVYAMNSNNLTFNNNVLNGSSWGLYLQYCNDGKIIENTIKNQEVTGILNFGSARTLIETNKIVNAKNHGIDVRHGTGPNVKVINNTVIGSKEGIYLMPQKDTQQKIIL